MMNKYLHRDRQDTWRSPIVYYRGLGRSNSRIEQQEAPKLKLSLRRQGPFLACLSLDATHSSTFPEMQKEWENLKCKALIFMFENYFNGFLTSLAHRKPTLWALVSGVF